MGGKAPFETKSARVTFRHAMAVAVVAVVAAFVAMAAVTGLALSEADRLLDRLGRSQDQLARITSIEAAINAVLLAEYEQAGPSERRRAVAQLSAQVRAYNATIAEERMILGDDPEVLTRQSEEARRGEALAALIDEMRAGFEGRDFGSASASDDALQEQRRRLRALAQQIEAGERGEARAAIERMRALKNRTTSASIALFSLVGVLCGAGAWVMARAVARPLRRLEAAAERVGRGDVASAPVIVRSFAEIHHVADAFNRLEGEVSAQRLALSRHNDELEAQVAARTAEIKASNARLAEIDRTRRLFFSKVSHELRTPATVIRSEAEVALRHADAPASLLRDSLEHVAANSAFLQRRLDDLLTLARAEDGRITLRREPVRLGDLLDEVIALAEPYTRSSGMALVDDGFDHPGPTVLGDAAWLQQAVLALIDNAAKFAVGSPALQLSLRADGEAATIGVADGGPGVSPEALPHLFDSFYQAPGSTTVGEGARGAAGGAVGGAVGGAGLGLSVTRWVVEQHGGAVSARNVEGRGLLVELRLPVAA